MFAGFFASSSFLAFCCWWAWLSSANANNSNNACNVNSDGTWNNNNVNNTNGALPAILFDMARTSSPDCGERSAKAEGTHNHPVIGKYSLRSGPLVQKETERCKNAGFFVYEKEEKLSGRC